MGEEKITVEFTLGELCDVYMCVSVIMWAFGKNDLKPLQKKLFKILDSYMEKHKSHVKKGVDNG